MKKWIIEIYEYVKCKGLRYLDGSANLPTLRRGVGSIDVALDFTCLFRNLYRLWQALRTQPDTWAS